MKPQPREISLFLELLSAAIWQQRPDPSLFEQVDEATWNAVMQHAIRQSVPALVADGVQMLPHAMKPPRKIALSLALMAEQTEQLNRRINHTLATVHEEYLAADFPFILLKGQANARYYPNPLHRTPGDLDFFLYRPGDCERANRWIISHHYQLEVAGHTHWSYDRDGVHIENHHEILNFELSKHNRLLHEIVSGIIQSKNFETITIDGATLHVFPADFNLLYLFMHLFHHFRYSGIGLRQICDWLLALSALHQKIDRTAFVTRARQFDLLRPMQIFASLAIRHLKADPTIFPFDIGKETRYAEMVMEDILRGGNFGLHHTDKNQRYIPNTRWHRYKTVVSRSCIFGGMAPTLFLPMPFTKFFRSIRFSLLSSKTTHLL